jgi:ParB/RepB/Spo0J family partition protein
VDAVFKSLYEKNQSLNSYQYQYRDMVELEEIEIKKIKILRNSRTSIDDVSELMNSIKQNGLLQPIGVWKIKDEYILAYGNRRLKAHKKLGYNKILALVSDKKLSEEQFLQNNLIENISREDLKPVELGKIVNDLREMGLSLSEISARTGINKHKLSSAYNSYSIVPKEFESQIGFIAGSEDKKGKLPVSASNAIVRMRIDDSKKKQVFKEAIKKEFTLQQLNLLDHILRTDVKFEEAIKMLDKSKVKLVPLVVSLEKIDELAKKYPEKSFTRIIKDILLNKLPIEENLIIEGS